MRSTTCIYFTLSHPSFCSILEPSLSGSFFLPSLSLCTRPLLVVSGFRTSGGWVLLLPLWLQRPLQSHHRLFLSLLPLSLYPHSCGGVGVGHRVTPGPFTTTTNVKHTHSLTCTTPQTHTHHTTPPHIYIAREMQLVKMGENEMVRIRTG